MRKFWKDLLERAIKTAAQSAAAAGVGLATNVLDLGAWQALGSAAAIGFLFSVLTSIGSLPVGDSGSASAVHLDPDQPSTSIR